MADNLSTRVGRIVSGSAHALLDALEGAMPEAIMQQALREIDQATDDVRAELGKTIASRHLASKRLTEQSSRHDELESQVELALTQKRDDLAKTAVEHQLDIEAQIPVLESTVSEMSARERELEGYVAALQAKRREMEEAFQDLLAAKARGAAEAEGGPAATGGAGAAKKVDSATNAFNRLMSREGAPTLGSVDRAKGSQLAELDKLSRQNRIEERLATIRARVADKE